jgi:hypothetical protein
VILVLAEVKDAAVVSLAGEFEPTPAAVLTCPELAADRSCLRHPDFPDSTITVEARNVGVAQIAGVVNLLAAVVPKTLTVYEPEEREYQASELHAWLLFFLSALVCPVVNRPTPLSLNGPVLNPIGWYHLARAAGIPLSAVSVDSAEGTNPRARGSGNLVEVVCLGGGILAPSGTAADRYTVELARRSGVEYLKARYTNESPTNVRFAGASSIPDPRCQRERRALVEYFRS